MHSPSMSSQPCSMRESGKTSLALCNSVRMVSVPPLSIQPVDLIRNRLHGGSIVRDGQDGDACRPRLADHFQDDRFGDDVEASRRLVKEAKTWRGAPEFRCVINPTL